MKRILDEHKKKLCKGKEVMFFSALSDFLHYFRICKKIIHKTKYNFMIYDTKKNIILSMIMTLHVICKVMTIIFII